MYLFSDWLLSRDLPLGFEDMEPMVLADTLRQFYAEIRQKNGKPYSRSGLINVRASLQRHLSSPPYNKTYNITRDNTFIAANHVIQAQVKKLREAGLDVTKHKECMEADDVRKIREYVDVKTPRGLQDKVFFDVLLQFARRGQEGLRELRKDSFIIRRDSKGRKYATPAYNEKEKNHNGEDPKVKDAKKIMYEQPQDPDCPVASLELYISKLNPNRDDFFQRPKPKVSMNDTVWYENCPVGKNALAKKMKELSTAAGCSKTYTNHCVRATATTTLARAGMSPEEICSVTGHRRTESLQNYIAEPTQEKRHEMSTILHQFGAKSQQLNGAVPNTTSADDNLADSAPITAAGHNISDTQTVISGLGSATAASINPLTAHTATTQGHTDIKVATALTDVSSILSGNNFYGPVNFYIAK